MNRKALAIVCSSALAVGGMFLLTGANSPTKAAVPAPFTSSQHFAGYATGTDVFADVLKNLSPGQELANVNVGYSASGANSDGLLDGYVPALPAQAASPGVDPHPAISAFHGTPSPNGVTPGKGIANEMDHAVVPPDEETFGKTLTDPFQSYGRGSGLEVGLGTALPNNPDLNQVILAGMAEQAATPKTPGGNTFPDNSITKEIGPVPADPLLFASLLHGQGAANWDADNCPGDPNGTFPVNPAPGGFDNSGGAANTDSRNALGWGLGNAAQVELINTATGPLAPKLGDPSSHALLATTGGQPTNRQVSSAKSFTHLVPNGDGTFALVSETHETIAPITLFKGDPTNQVTIEVLGEAVLKAVATGTGSTSKVTYVAPPTIRITQINMPPQVIIPPPPGLGIPPIVIPGLAEIFIGEQARASDQAVPGNSDADAAHVVKPIVQADGTVAWGAVDVVRVKLLPPSVTSHVAEVRVEHMEAQATVPAGGVTCSTASPAPGGGGSTTSTGPGGGGSTTTTGPGGGGTTTTTSHGGGGSTTTTAPGAAPGNATTTTTGPGGGGATTTTANPGTSPGNTTPTTAATKPNNNNNNTTTTGPAQVQAVTFSQTPAATPQSQTPNFTG